MNNAYLFLLRASDTLYHALIAYGAGDASALATIQNYVSADGKYLALTPRGNLDEMSLTPPIEPAE